MLVTEELPKEVTYSKVSDWVTFTPFNEGIHLVTSFFSQADRRCNALLFYCYCYVRTGGFRNPCWYNNWDAANVGSKYATSKDGIQDALSIFLSFEETSLIQEEDEVLKLYGEVVAYCKGIVYTEPTPLPDLPVPTPPPAPVPEPVPQPEPIPTPENKTSFKWLQWVLPILGVAATAASVFLPGWAKVVIDIVMKLLTGLAG
jgi:hypothetical protein